MLYLFNSPVLTACGDYRMRPCTLADACERLRAAFVSAVGHAGAADVMSRELGVAVPCVRQAVCMQPGDVALVLAAARGQGDVGGGTRGVAARVCGLGAASVSTPSLHAPRVLDAGVGRQRIIAAGNRQGKCA